MPISNESFLAEDCSDISDWTDLDNDTGESSQVTFDSKSCFKFDSGASTDSPQAGRSIDVGSFGNRVVVSFSLYVDAAVKVGWDCFQFKVTKGDVRLEVIFGSDGIFVNDGSAWNEVGVDLVVLDTWQEWTFDIDFTTPASATVDVYLNGSLVGDGVDCSYELAGTDGKVFLYQFGYATANQISYVDWIKVGDAFQTDWEKSLSDTVTLSDGIAKQSGLAKADSVSLSDSLAKALGVNKSDSVALSDSLVSKRYSKALADTVSLVDGFSRVVAYKRTLADSIDLADSIAKLFARAFTDSLTLSDAFLKSIELVLADSITLTDFGWPYLILTPTALTLGARSIQTLTGDTRDVNSLGAERPVEILTEVRRNDG